MMGININDSGERFTKLILEGKKSIETRDTNSLAPYLGKRVGIVKTGRGMATLVGYATIGEEPILYNDAESFKRDEKKHRVTEDSKYNLKTKKFGYVLRNVNGVFPRFIETRGIIARRVPEEHTSASMGEIS